MDPDDEINRLSEQLRSLAQNHPREAGILRISPTAFRACTKDRWNSHNWELTEEECQDIRSGIPDRMRHGLLSRFGPDIQDVEFSPGIDTICVVPVSP